MKKYSIFILGILFATGITIVNAKDAPKVSLDTTPPTIESNDKITLENGTKFNIKNYYSVSDNISKENKIGVVGNVDTSKEGDYLITITATDEAGNMTVKKIRFYVEAKKTEEESKKQPVQNQTSANQGSQSRNNNNPQTYNPNYGQPNQSAPVYNPPAQQTVVPAPPDGNSGGATYYEEDSSTSSSNFGTYGSEEACRAVHGTGQCIPYVGSDGITVQGYIWTP